MKQALKLRVNGSEEEVFVEPWWSLAHVLRETLGLTGTKVGCEAGDCGSCTVLIDGAAVRSCQYPVKNIAGKSVTTIEGLAQGAKLDPLQEAFARHDALQCGYCTPGMILVAHEFLRKNPKPSEQQVRDALEGNICRCGCHVRIIEAVMDAARAR